ncbi:hypothetical protein [Sphingomonas lacusdianchii]|uniref:hypothetical protein n=1 Tax=Sphingomonas lacusdianchii TaxID=2917992 RepID=UPI001F566F10|nr:hypothetical protein [Sphingomonas sp. JXJ CY 53]
MDFTKQRVSQTAPMHVRNAAGTPMYDGDKPVRIIFYGPASRQFAELETRQSERAVKRNNDNEGKVVARSSEERRAEAVADLLSLTAGFENLDYEDKTGAELYAAVYNDAELGYILNQGVKFVGEWGNFSGSAPKN